MEYIERTLERKFLRMSSFFQTYRPRSLLMRYKRLLSYLNRSKLCAMRVKNAVCSGWQDRDPGTLQSVKK